MDTPRNSSSHIWETISVEVEGAFQKSPLGNEYVVVLTDLYSKWIEAKPLAEKNALGVSSFIMSTFARMGFAECKFFNMEYDFEVSIRRAIHVQGSPFVQNVDKFNRVLKKIWCEELMSKQKIEDDEGIVVDKVLNTTSETDGKSVHLGGSTEKGYHTEKLLQWIEQNPTAWDSGLEEYLFRLRMGSNEDGDVGECNSPFAVMYGRSAMPYSGVPVVTDQTPPVKQRGWPRGRSRSRGRGRGRGRKICSVRAPLLRKDVDTSNAASTEGQTDINDVGSEQINAATKSAGNPIGVETDKGSGTDGTVLDVCRRMKGRPRKSQNPMKYMENSGKADVENAKQAVTDWPLTNKKYGLRTNLKAKVKTNIVQRMLKLSACKRSSGNTEINTLPRKKLKTYSLQKVITNRPQLPSDSLTSSNGSSEPEFILGTGELADGTKITTDLQGITLYEDTINNEIVSVLTTNTSAVSGIRPGSSILKVQNKILSSASTVSRPEGSGEPELQLVDAMEDSEEVDGGDDDDDDNDEVDDLEDDDDIEQDEDDQNDDVDGDENGEKPKVACPNCPGLLLTEHELTIHSTFHKDGSKLLHCLYCTHVAATWDHMQDHLMGHIENNTAPGAATMLKKLRGSRAAAVACRKLRRRELQGTPALRCSLCVSVRMATVCEQQVHQSCHREDSRLLHCPHCPHVSGNWLQMQHHLSLHPEVPSEAYAVPIEEKTCPRCHKVFATADMVVAHQLIFHARDRRFQCELCGKTFKERKSILRHQELHANVVYQCGECTYKTKIHRDYLDHQRIHQGLGYTCELCNKVFARHTQLTLHLECHRKDRGTAICDQCGHQANGMAALRHHIRNVHGTPQSWACSQCSYVGKTKSNLKGHTDRIHNKKFKCTQCDFACLAECTLAKHVDIFHNEGERRYPCPHCPYRAREPKCLTEHIRVLHNPFAVKFPCEFCGTEFKTKSMLRDHMPQHTGQRFVCQLCGYIAKYRSILYRHVKKRHPGHNLSAVMKNTEPLVTQTPDGKPILPPKTRAPRRRYSTQRNVETATLLLDNTSIDAENPSALAFVTSELANGGTATLVEAGGELDGSSMFIATTAEGETVAVDQNSIVLDANLLAQAAAGGQITLPNNLCLQIIHKDQDGENITMQVIPAHMTGDDDDKAVELLLLASEDLGEVVTEEDVGNDEHSSIIIE